MTKEQKNMVLAAIDAAEKWELTTGKEVMTLHVNSEFFKTLKELVAYRLDYSKHILVDDLCEDCVSRETFSEIFDEATHKSYDWAEQYPKYRGIILSGMQYVLDIFKQVFELPSVTPERTKAEWIPLTWDESKCNSSFPDNMDGCWVFFTDGKKMSVERAKKDAFDHFFPAGRWFEMSDAVAWMPLPEPYKEEKPNEQSNTNS